MGANDMKIKSNVIAITMIGMLILSCFAISPAISSTNASKKLSKLTPSVEMNGYAFSTLGSFNTLTEGFEDGLMPPIGWYTIESNTAQPWFIVNYTHSGDYAAWINYDSSTQSDNWLVSPNIDLTGYVKANLTFWAASDTGYPTATMELHIRGEGFDDILWDMIQDEDWDTFEYRELTFDLSAYVDKTINISWRYVGLDGESFALDDISVKTNDVLLKVNNLSPINNAIGVGIDQTEVSANISAFKQTLADPTLSMNPIQFMWEIGGDNITTNSSSVPDIQGYKSAVINGPLQYNTIYHWYVNVSAEDVYKNVSFSFTTEMPPNQPPVANFTYVINDLTGIFTSTSTDLEGQIANWTWDFGDGNSSYLENPQHSYENNGIYYVTLTVKDNESASDSITKEINVTNPPPVAHFTATVDGNMVYFDPTSSYDTSGTIVSYTWYFGDETNVTYPNNRTVRHTYVQDYKTYTATLIVTDSAGETDSYSEDVTINDTTNPTVKIVQPEKGLYIDNVKKRNYLIRMPFIIGDIDIKVNATDKDGSGVARVEFYINNKPIGNDTVAPYNFTWHKDRIRLFHIFRIKVVAYDEAGNSAEAKMIVRKIF